RTLRCGGDGLGRVRDLSHDFDYVAVRVVDPQLAVGARAPADDRTDALELALAPQLARVRLEVAEGAPDELRDRDAVAPAGGEIDHRRLQPVAGGQPFVLGSEDAVVGRDLRSTVELLGVELDQRLAERGDGDRVLEAR